MKMASVGMTLLLGICLAVLAVACAEQGDEPPPTPSPELEDQLQRMVLQLEDLPSGVIRAEEFFVTNELSAAESEDREERLAMLNEWGRILGYDVTYQANPEVMSQIGLILANSTASLYASDEGASASFADGVQTARTTDWASLFSGVQEVESEELPSPKWADEMFWLRITARAEAGEGAEEETFASDFVLFRQGRGRVALMVGWIMGKSSGDIVAPLAQAQAQRLKQALP